MANTTIIKQNKTKTFFYKIIKSIYMSGSANYWFEDLKFSKLTSKMLDSNVLIFNAIISVLILSEWAALFTQKNLTEKQISDLILFSLSHPVLFFNAVCLGWKKEKVREVLFNMAVKFKSVYSDLDIEEHMIKKAKWYSGLFISFFVCTLVTYGLAAFNQLMAGEGTFTTLITAWPDVVDTSIQAHIARVVIYVIWWIFLCRILPVYWVIIPTTICLNHQFKNLCSYFYSLNGIFETDLSQKEKEMKYEEAFKIGIKLHSDILKCTKDQEYISYTVFGGQILLNLSVLVVLMSQMLNSERDMGTTVAVICTSASIIVTTGCLMCNAGDVTVEASRLSTAMFESGWHNCHKAASMRVRPLLTVAMSVSQKPVTLNTLGIVTISYESYVRIVRSTYSIFSFLY